MRDTVPQLRKRLSELTRDLARLKAVIAEHPEVGNHLHPTVLALTQGIVSVESRIAKLQPTVRLVALPKDNGPV